MYNPQSIMGQFYRRYGMVPPSVRAANEASRPFTLEEQESLAQELLGGGLSAVGTVANVLDTPGSWIRNMLAAEVPWKGTFDAQERTTGREMLEKWGALDRNVEGLDLGDVGGFGAEVMLDPLTYLTLGASALTKSGKLASRIGKLPTSDIADVTGKLVKGAGRREKMARTTLKDVLEGAKEGAEGVQGNPVMFARMKKAASGMGIDEKGLEALLESGESLGGTAKWFGAQFGSPKLARGMDVLGHGVRYSGPGRFAARLTSPAVRGTKSILGQAEAALGFGAGTTREAEVLKDAALREQIFTKAGLGEDSSPELLDKMRSSVEGQWRLGKGESSWATQAHGLSTDELVELATEKNLGGYLGKLVDEKKINDGERSFIESTLRIMSNQNLKHYKELDSLGFAVDRWLDEASVFFPRTAKGRRAKGFLGTVEEGAFKTETPAQIRRHKFLAKLLSTEKHAGGAAAIHAALRDPRLFKELDVSGTRIWAKGSGLSESERVKVFFKEWLGKSDKDWEDVQKALGAKGDVTVVDVGAGHPIIGEFKSEDYSGLVGAYRQAEEATKWVSSQKMLGKEETLFSRSALRDHAVRAVHNVQAIESSKAVYRLLKRSSKSAVDAADDDVLLFDVLAQATNLGSKKSANRKMIAHMAEELGLPTDHVLRNVGADNKSWNAALESFRSGDGALYVSKNVAEDIGHVMRVYLDPDSGGAFKKMYDRYNNTFRALQTTPFPAFHIRNAMTAMWQNFVIGAFDPTLGRFNPFAYAKPLSDMRHFVKTGKLPKGWKDVPHFKDMTEEQALMEWRSILYAHHVAPRAHLYSTEVAGGAAEAAAERKTMEELHGIPGKTTIEEPGYFGVKSLARGYKESLLHPKRDINILGVKGGIGKTARRADELGEDVLGFIKGGREAGRYVEEVNRMAAMWSKMKQGFEPGEAADISRAAHVDYRLNTEWERMVAKRIFPFYQFTARMVPWQLTEIARRPGGPVPKAIRAAGQFKGEGYVPEHLQSTLGIEVGGDEESKQYLTGVDLPHEIIDDLLKPKYPKGDGFLSYLKSGLDTLTGTALGLASQASPIVKFPIELTGYDLHSGRDLRSMTGTIGDIIGPRKIGEDVELPRQIHPFIEKLLGTVPASRFANTIAKMAKAYREPSERLPAALSLGTGARMATVKHDKRYYDLRDALRESLAPLPATYEHPLLGIRKGGWSDLTDEEKRRYRGLRKLRKPSEMKTL